MAKKKASSRKIVDPLILEHTLKKIIEHGDPDILDGEASSIKNAIGIRGVTKLTELLKELMKIHGVRKRKTNKTGQDPRLM